mgnify:CR=1 FL=1
MKITLKISTILGLIFFLYSNKAQALIASTQLESPNVSINDEVSIDIKALSAFSENFNTVIVEATITNAHVISYDPPEGTEWYLLGTCNEALETFTSSRLCFVLSKDTLLIPDESLGTFKIIVDGPENPVGVLVEGESGYQNNTDPMFPYDGQGNFFELTLNSQPTTTVTATNSPTPTYTNSPTPTVVATNPINDEIDKKPIPKSGIEDIQIGRIILGIFISGFGFILYQSKVKTNTISA